MNDDLWDRVGGLGSETSIDCEQVQVPSQRNANDMPDIVRAMPVKGAIEMEDCN